MVSVGPGTCAQEMQGSELGSSCPVHFVLRMFTKCTIIPQSLWDGCHYHVCFSDREWELVGCDVELSSLMWPGANLFLGLPHPIALAGESHWCPWVFACLHPPSRYTASICISPHACHKETDVRAPGTWQHQLHILIPREKNLSHRNGCHTEQNILCSLRDEVQASLCHETVDILLVLDGSKTTF